MASWNRCSSVCTLLLLAESALCKEQIALLLSFWSKERVREKIPTQMMLGFVSGCLAMMHLGVCLLLLFSLSLVLLADGFFCAFLPQPIFFPFVIQYFTPTAFKFSFIQHSGIHASKIILYPLPASHLFLPLATPGPLGWISPISLGTGPVPLSVFLFWIYSHCSISQLSQWIHLDIVAAAFSFYFSCRIRGIFKNQTFLWYQRNIFSKCHLT